MALDGLGVRKKGGIMATTDEMDVEAVKAESDLNLSSIVSPPFSPTPSPSKPIECCASSSSAEPAPLHQGISSIPPDRPRLFH